MQQQQTAGLPPNSPLVGQPPPATGVQLQTTSSRWHQVVSHFKDHQARALGTTMIVVGALSFIATAVLYVLVFTGSTKDHDLAKGEGGFCGVMCIVVGSLALGASRSKSRCMIVAVMVMSIIAFCTCLTQLLASIFLTTDASSALHNYYNDDRYYNTTETSLPTTVVHELRSIVATAVLLIVLALVSSVASLWTSAICGQAVVRRQDTSPAYGVVQYAPMTVVNEQGQMMAVTYVVPASNQYPVQPGQPFVSLPPYNGQPTAVVSNIDNPPAYGVENQTIGGGQDNTGLPEKS